MSALEDVEAVAVALRAAGAVAELEHTGGNVWVVAVPARGGWVIVSEDGSFTVGFYAGDGWDDGDEHTAIVFELRSLAEVVGAVRGFGGIA